MTGRVPGLASLGLVLAVGLFPGSEQAGLLFNNLFANQSSYDSVYSGSSATPLYESFSTGGQGVYLTSTSLMLIDPTPTDGGTLAVAILNGSGSSPGSIIQPLGLIPDTSLSSGPVPVPSAVALSAFAPVALAPNTRYWIRVQSNPRSSTPSGGGWVYDISSRGIGVSTQSTFSPTFGLTPNSGSYPVYMMSITAVPEPWASAILIVGLIGTGIAARKRRAT